MSLPSLKNQNFTAHTHYSRWHGIGISNFKLAGTVAKEGWHGRAF